MLGAMRLEAPITTPETGSWDFSIRKQVRICNILLKPVQTSDLAQLLDMTTASRLVDATVRDNNSDERQFIVPVDFTLQHLAQSQHQSVYHGSPAVGRVPCSIDLPPSLCARTDLSLPGSSRCSATIAYFLRARVLVDGRTLAYHSQEITIFPCHVPDPPTCNSDFPGEYCLWQQRTLRTRLFRKWATLTVKAEEPRVFILRPGRWQSVSRLVLDLQLETKPVTDTNSPICIEASVTWTLEALTLFSISANHMIPTLHQARYTPGSGIITNSVFTREVKVMCRNWVWRDHETDSLPKSQKRRWSAREDILMIMDDLSNLPPTFFTPFLSRRYRVRVMVRLHHQYVLSQLEIRVPVQVLYDCDERPPPPDTWIDWNHLDSPYTHVLPWYTP